MQKPIHHCTRCSKPGTVPETLVWGHDEPWLAQCSPPCMAPHCPIDERTTADELAGGGERGYFTRGR